MVKCRCGGVCFLENTVKKVRIWELDAFRGICILGVIAVHTIYDLTEIFGVSINIPFYSFVKDYGSLLFILLSGVCVTLGRRSVLRGAVVLGCGVVISLVMAVLTYIDPYSFGNIYFGILHLLGCCMLIYPCFKRLPVWALAVVGIMCVGAGFYLEGVKTAGLTPLVIFGVRYPGFYTADYFPLFPNLGWFLLGAVLGRTVYKSKQSLLPRFPYQNVICRFFMLCGRQSLWIYLLHQPIVFGVLWLVFNI